jgi:phosphoribosylanthranilate isomerase
MRTRIKICGITRPEDAEIAALLGVDAIGLVFHDPSPRRIDESQAARIVAALPPFVHAVALFVDAPAARIREAIGRLRIDMLQFHGEESPDFCRGFGLPYIKAIRMRPGVDLTAAARRYADAAALLLDTWRKGVPGGTGATFAWQPLPSALGIPVMLAGGLRPDNVADAIRIVRPYGVDVSGGVESAGGIKDREKLSAFFAAVAAADRERARDG